MVSLCKRHLYLRYIAETLSDDRHRHSPGLNGEATRLPSWWQSSPIEAAHSPSSSQYGSVPTCFHFIELPSRLPAVPQPKHAPSPPPTPTISKLLTAFRFRHDDRSCCVKRSVGPKNRENGDISCWQTSDHTAHKR